jgi:hypothetical protein
MQPVGQQRARALALEPREARVRAANIGTQSRTSRIRVRKQLNDKV